MKTIKLENRLKWKLEQYSVVIEGQKRGLVYTSTNAKNKTQIYGDYDQKAAKYTSRVLVINNNVAGSYDTLIDAQFAAQQMN